MPDWKLELTAVLARLNLSPAHEALIAEELAQHLTEQYTDLLANGMPELDAKRAVLAGLNDSSFADSMKALFESELPSLAVHPPGGCAFFSNLANDLRYAIRTLLAKPSFTVVALLSLAMGIGATTAIFSVVHAVLIDPYPYRAADRIGSLRLTSKSDNLSEIGFTRSQFLEIRSRMRSMEDAIAISGNQVVMTERGAAQIIEREECSPNFFEFFGVPPLLGRTFTANNVHPTVAQEPVAVLSFAFWQQSFGGRPDILGQHLRLNDKQYTVIGVMPARFTWLGADTYVPMDMSPSQQDFVLIEFRIKPRVSQSQVNAEFQPMIEEFRRLGPRLAYPEGVFTVKFLNLNEGVLGRFSTTLLALFGAVALLLFIGCANVANLLLARAATRQGEMAIRLSMGATRWRLICQLLTESLLLAVSGGVLGVGLAYGGIRAVVSLMPQYSIPSEAVIALNWPVLGFALVIALLTGILFGLAPALQATGEAQERTLRASGRGTISGTNRMRLHDTLTVGEIALSLVLLIGAGLAIRGFVALQSQTLGFDPHRALTFEVPLSEGHETQWATRIAFFHEIVRQLRREPQVQAAAVSAFGVPPKDGTDTKAILDDRPADQAPVVSMNLVQDGYFASIGSKLLRGHDLSEADVAQARPVVVISEDFAKRAFSGGENPLGHHMQLALFKEQLPPQFLRPPQFVNSFEIVGVVETARNRGLNDQPVPAVFIPYSFLVPPAAIVVARTFGDPNALVSVARNVVRKVDPSQPISYPRSLEDLLTFETKYPKFNTFLFSVFGAIGLVLAATGVFSVVSYAVTHRTREFGIRMALGAQPRDVVRLVLTATARVLFIGISAGLGLGVLASRFLATRMEGMGTADLLLFVSVPAVLLVTTLIACLLPARLATRIEPTEALHHE